MARDNLSVFQQSPNLVRSKFALHGYAVSDSRSIVELEPNLLLQSSLHNYPVNM
jgi:hypothetical protein